MHGTARRGITLNVSQDPPMKAELLHEEFAPRSLATGAERLLLRPADAVDLIDRAAEEGVPIVRVDRADLPPERGDVALERVADFSAAVAEGHGCWDEAEHVIRSPQEREVAFELTLGDDPIEVV